VLVRWGLQADNSVKESTVQGKIKAGPTRNSCAPSANKQVRKNKLVKKNGAAISEKKTTNDGTNASTENKTSIRDKNLQRLKGYRAETIKKNTPWGTKRMADANLPKRKNPVASWGSDARVPKEKKKCPKKPQLFRPHMLGGGDQTVSNNDQLQDQDDGGGQGNKNSESFYTTGRPK